MAFVLNPSIEAFFTLYPDAADVYSTEDGQNIYLNQFLEKAKIEAGINVKKLYVVDSDKSETRIFPTSFLYTIIYDINTNGNVYDIYVGEQSIEPEAQTAVKIAEAWDALLVDEGILALPTVVEEVSSGVMKMSIITDSDLILKVTNTLEDEFYLDQIFN